MNDTGTIVRILEPNIKRDEYIYNFGVGGKVYFTLETESVKENSIYFTI